VNVFGENTAADSDPAVMNTALITMTQVAQSSLRKAGKSNSRR
jgi:hypothetical protein